MELKNKKTLAREILIFCGVIFISLFCFLCMYLYNYYQQNKIDNLQNEIESQSYISDTLSTMYNMTLGVRESFLNVISLHMNKKLPTKEWSNNSWKAIFRAYREDKIDQLKFISKKGEIVNLLKSSGYSNIDQLKSHISLCIISPNDSLNYLKSIAVNSNVRVLSDNLQLLNGKLINSNELLNYPIWVLSFLFIIVYPLRYFYIAIKWSIVTINIPNNND